MPENDVPSEAHGRDLLRLIDSAEAQVAELRSGLDEAQRQEFMGLVGAAIAHEIGNVLTPVRGFAEAALARPGDPGLTAKALRAAAAGAERACSIAEAILDCARGGLETARANVAAATLRAVDLAVVPGPVFHVEQDIDTSIDVGLSQVALEQVLLNLLLNARAAGARLVTVEAQRGGDGWGSVLVKDDGRGIAPAMVERIFAPFESAGGGRGRGLGLTICRYLVESAGGRLRVASAVGSGSCFTIELPLAQRAARAA